MTTTNTETSTSTKIISRDGLTVVIETTKMAYVAAEEAGIWPMCQLLDETGLGNGRRLLTFRAW